MIGLRTGAEEGGWGGYVKMRFFFVKKHVFGHGALPQAPFFPEKIIFLSVSRKK